MGDKKAFNVSEYAREYASKKNYGNPKQEAIAMFAFQDGWASAKDYFFTRPDLNAVLEECYVLGEKLVGEDFGGVNMGKTDDGYYAGVSDVDGNTAEVWVGDAPLELHIDEAKSALEAAQNLLKKLKERD